MLHHLSKQQKWPHKQTNNRKFWEGLLASCPKIVSFLFFELTTQNEAQQRMLKKHVKINLPYRLLAKTNKILLFIIDHGGVKTHYTGAANHPHHLVQRA